MYKKYLLNIKRPSWITSPHSPESSPLKQEPIVSGHSWTPAPPFPLCEPSRGASSTLYLVQLVFLHSPGSSSCLLPADFRCQPRDCFSVSFCLHLMDIYSLFKSHNLSFQECVFLAQLSKLERKKLQLC